MSGKVLILALLGISINIDMGWPRETSPKD